MSETHVHDFIDELGAGVFKEKLAHLLSDVAQGTVLHGGKGKKGKIFIELTLLQIGDNEQVMISHKLGHTTPTRRGKRSEEDLSQTSMFVGKGGEMTINPPKEDNNGQFSLDQENSGIHRIK